MEGDSKLKSRFTKKLVNGIKSVVNKVKKAVKTFIHKTIGRIIHDLTHIDWENVKMSVIARYLAMFVLIINMILEKSGMNPLPFSGTDVYEVISDALTILMFIVNTWKNNSTTAEAIAADELLETLKQQKEMVDESETE